jgi:signal peptidase I
MSFPTRRRPNVRSALTLLVTVAVVVIMTTSIRAYAVQAYVVPSPSMTPTLQIGDRIVVDKLSSTVHRGDIIVFRRAPGDHDPQYPVLVKRVIRCRSRGSPTWPASAPNPRSTSGPR